MTVKSEKLEIKKATIDDLRFALSQGVADFLKTPLFGLFFGGIYAIGGIVMFCGIFVFEMFWLAYPLVIGFSLIGPFIATGLYEVSRRLGNDAELSWPDILGVIWLQHRRELGWMAFVMLFIFWVWMYQIRTLVAVFFGFAGFASFSGFVDAVLTTSNGWTFLLAGHLVGAVLSIALFMLTVISCPLLLDRDTDFVTAMITSIKTVLKSPFAMFGWGFFVIVSVTLSMLPAFLGLVFALPILGHATWHLYRRLIGASHI
ncbi:MAG: DUF2189 domain-containing protein [Roseovarius sp.]|nr:DUF2189 domain-containing protein [Roseovarius sp.]MCY4207697.1 DUF2189 domain-containing protein [Roseovarius sp.]MCY4290513.1 DUF2189 domain-containing protein [Roseovarius sp.]